jgi:hypothetical protein
MALASWRSAGSKYPALMSLAIISWEAVWKEKRMMLLIGQIDLARQLNDEAKRGSAQTRSLALARYRWRGGRRKLQRVWIDPPRQQPQNHPA